MRTLTAKSAKDGNRLSRIISGTAFDEVIREDYTYDVLGQLIRVDGGGDMRAKYEYDPMRNRHPRGITFSSVSQSPS